MQQKGWLIVRSMKGRIIKSVCLCAIKYALANRSVLKYAAISAFNSITTHT